jgi:hypothetical protein
LTDRAGNVAPGSVYPDQMAPIIRHGQDGPELVKGGGACRYRLQC